MAGSKEWPLGDHSDFVRMRHSLLQC